MVSKNKVRKYAPDLDIQFWMDGNIQPMMAITWNFDKGNWELISGSAFLHGLQIADFCRKNGKEGKKYEEFLKRLFRGFQERLEELDVA